MPGQLKSFTLQGYKTFATKTDFIFADKVTAIVGPNGSGKSNIADAIRWVLGEQSYSLLRGRKTEDMIFSGSEHRSRSGMASATILFDNQDGWLPVDYSEVAITRRAYRDGENEYLLNGQHVRLKNVTELLSKSGLAERTYTIIGQGLVDAALALKAEERRRLFEEAAGIGLFRVRREEALRRLETTRRNLDRVQDILFELQPRLRSLERQARRFNEYEQVRSDLRVVLREWYGYHWQLVQHDLAIAIEHTHRHEKIVEEARVRQSEQEKKLDEHRNTIREYRDRLKDWHLEQSRLHTKLEQLNKNLAVGYEKDRALKAQINNHLDELSKIEAEIEALEQRKIDQRVLVDTINLELDEYRRQGEIANNILESKQFERRRQEDITSEIRRELAELIKQQAQLQAKVSERQSYCAKQMLNLEIARKKKNELTNQLSLGENTIHDLRKVLETSQIEQVQVEEDFHKEQKNAQSWEAERQEMLKRISSLNAQYSRSHAQYEVLQQAEEQLSGYSQGAKVLLKALKEAEIKGVGDLLGRIIEVPEYLEKAIQALLGEFIDIVIMRAESEDHAIDIILSEGVRGSFINTQDVSSLITHERLVSDIGSVEKGVIGYVSDLIKMADDNSGVIQALFNNSIVVDNRQTARKILREDKIGTVTNLRIVTLSGEVFHQSGLIQIGSTKKIFDRRRELERVRKDLDDIGNNLKDAEIQLSLIDKEIESCNLKIDLSGQLVEESKRKAVFSNQAYLNKETELTKIKNALVWQDELISDHERDLNAAQLEITQIQQNLAVVDESLKEINVVLKEAMANLSEFNLEEEQREAERINTRIAVYDREVALIKQRVDEISLEIKNRSERKEYLSSRMKILEEEDFQILSECSQWQKEEGEVNHQLHGLSDTIEPAESTLTKLEIEQQQHEYTDNEARQSLRIAEHNYSQARITFAHQQDVLESLQRKIEDDLGLVDFVYEETISGRSPLPISGLVDKLPVISEISPELEEIIKRQKAQLNRIGPINPEALTEYQQVKERYEFLTNQLKDLQAAEEDVKEVIVELDQLMETEFRKTFDRVAVEFRHIFTRLFGGGSAQLVLTDPDDLSGTGIDIEAKLPGRREQGLSLLSGGERSLAATSLIFALLRISPTPFCILDEVDAMLDEVNVGRFRDLLLELSEKTQFIIITHNRNTVQIADIIYGVTMGRDSSSQVISLKLDEVSEEYSRP